MANQKALWPIRGYDDQSEDMIVNQRACKCLPNLSQSALLEEHFRMDSLQLSPRFEWNVSIRWSDIYSMIEYEENKYGTWKWFGCVAWVAANTSCISSVYDDQQCIVCYGLYLSKSLTLWVWESLLAWIFSWEEAALQVLLSVCVCVCVSVWVPS